MSASRQSPLYAPRKNLVLAASAGTGKTHALVGVVIHALVADRAAPDDSGAILAPIDPARIVATTFSRKAAAEIRARVSSELERLATSPKTSAYVESLRAHPSGRTVTDETIRGRARRALARVVYARFGTLHSFAASVVRGYAIELGLGPGFEIAPEADTRMRADDAIAAALGRRLVSDEAAVRSLAEAAGGIDRLVLQLRRTLVRLEEDGRSARTLAVPDDDVEAIERQMVRFVDHARSLATVPRWDELANEVLAAWSARTERSEERERLERAVVALASARASAKHEAVVDFSAYKKSLPGATNEEKGRLLARTYVQRDAFASIASVARDVLGEAEEEIRERSRASAALGFGDVLRAARELLVVHPDIATEIGSEIDALLVDEFQDTSRVQRDLIQLLWARPEARPESGVVPPLSAMRTSGLLVVGDRKQSIYGFRGADVGVFAELAVGLAGAPAREALGIPAGVTWEPAVPTADFRALRHNRRSRAEILSFANAFSDKRFLPAEPPPELFEIEYVPETEDLLVPPEHEATADTELASFPRTTWLRVEPKGSSSTRLEEAFVIAERIEELLHGEPEHDGDALRVGRDRRTPSYRDIAVLATTNGMLDAVAFALAQRGIPHVVAGRSFFQTREVRDLAAMLSLILDPTDRLAALEVLRGPWAGVHDETLLGLTDEGRGLVGPSAWQRPPVAELVRPEDRPLLTAVSDLVTSLSRCAGRVAPGPLLREAVRALAFDEVLAGLPRGAQRLANMDKLLALADREADARAFKARIDDAAAQEAPESEAATFSDDDDAVRLLTIHASKGLDFPIVFVPEIGAPLPRSEKGALRVMTGAGDDPNVLAVRIADPSGVVLEPPSFTRAYAIAKRRERAERQRLAYVAITRAADAMFLVGGTAKDPAPGTASSLAVLHELAAKADSASYLSVAHVDVPASRVVAWGDDAVEASDDASPSLAEEVRRPAWRSLPIAPTALADFAHCARRFELVHVLGLPEHVRGRTEGRTEKAEKVDRTDAVRLLDARTQGTIAHAVLERVPTASFGGSDAEQAASEALASEGVSETHPQHAAIVARVARFLRGSYAGGVASGAIHREMPFVLDVPDHEGRRIVLRGSMDLVVVGTDGSVDVIDYKSARGGAVDAYAFQLDVYSLAARAAFPDASALRVGVVFLGGGDGEPRFRLAPPPEEIRGRLASLGASLVEARWSGAFPRVALERCEAIHCGFIGRCHAALPSSSSDEKNGTDENASDVTTT